MIITIFIFFVLAISALFVLGYDINLKKQSDIKIQQYMCNHCMYKPKVKTPFITIISQCSYRESEYYCSKWCDIVMEV